MITVHFACGHELTFESGAKRPTCVQCGETRISRTFAPPPSFRGICTGPTAEYDPTIAPFNAVLKQEDL